MQLVGGKYPQPLSFDFDRYHDVRPPCRSKRSQNPAFFRYQQSFNSSQPITRLPPSDYALPIYSFFFESKVSRWKLSRLLKLLRLIRPILIRSSRGILLLSWHTRERLLYPFPVQELGAPAIVVEVLCLHLSSRFERGTFLFIQGKRLLKPPKRASLFLQ